MDDVIFNEHQDAYLIFSNGEKIKLKGYGKTGIFEGFLTFIDGFFTIEELRYNSDFKKTKQIFCYDNVSILIGDNKQHNENHTIVITYDLPYDIEVDDERFNNITLLTGFDKNEFQHILNCNDFKEKQGIKCCVIFNNEYNEELFEEAQKKLNKLPDNANGYNYLSKYKNKKPYRIIKNGAIDDKNIKKLDIFTSNKTIGIYDFGISPVLLDILKTYWNAIVLPYDNTAKRTDFLKLDGIVISNSLSNTKFVKENIKNEIIKLMNGDIPVLGIGFGAILMSECVNIGTYEQSNEYIYNEYIIRNDSKKNFEVSSDYLKQIENVKKTNDIDVIFQNAYNKNAVGIKKDNNVMFNFDFFDNNIDTARILNIFEILMNERKREYKWN